MRINAERKKTLDLTIYLGKHAYPGKMTSFSWRNKSLPERLQRATKMKRERLIRALRSNAGLNALVIEEKKPFRVVVNAELRLLRTRDRMLTLAWQFGKGLARLIAALVISTASDALFRWNSNPERARWRFLGASISRHENIDCFRDKIDIGARA